MESSAKESTKEAYGLRWPVDMEPLEIEMWFVKRGGHAENKKGEKCGLGLSHHIGEMRKIIWPELHDERHGQRWHKLCRDAQATHRVCTLMGPGSSGKTHEAAWFRLCEWLADPENTVVLVSSTDMRGLRMRVWGEIASLWERAVQRFDFLPGHMVDSKLAITYDAIDEEGDDRDRAVRDFRRACVGIPTVQNGRQVGLGKWIGIKQNKVRLVADEGQAMDHSFLSAFANLNKNSSFSATVLGNPSDILDALGRCAEPLDGWDGHMEPEKTTTWKTRFMDGICVNLIGLDSPSFDFPNEPNKFPYLINKRKIDETLAFFPKDSYEYYAQCVGSMKIGTLARRVLTRRICEDGKALSHDVIWEGGNRTKIYAVDAGYGSDRCVGGWAEFGKAVGGQTVLLLHPQSIIPVSARIEKEPEQQIAEFVRKECEANGVPPENMAFDSTGRGSLGTFLARVWSDKCNPIEFGGSPTDRPMSLDEYIVDPKTKQRRPKTAKECVDRFVGELWFAVRFAIQAGQIRGLSREAMEEGCMREWDIVSNDRKSVETKTVMKERVGRSPDLMDQVAIIVEIARRKGFQISKLANESTTPNKTNALLSLSRQQQALIRSKELVFQ